LKIAKLNAVNFNNTKVNYKGLNGHRYSKNSKKVENSMSHFWEAMKVKFGDTYVHLGYLHTKFRPILRGSCVKVR
jgi:hypothetical protein